MQEEECGEQQPGEAATTTVAGVDGAGDGEPQKTSANLKLKT